ncbi:hypothetical protein Ddc_04034 [Ditylenchus destructor]|nr:hypothetical protein Ddc_04034 [Ditylenchus destructor]
MNAESNNFDDIFVLLHISKAGALLLWNPARMEKRFIQNFKGAKLGEWYRIDKESGLVAPTSATCDTKVDNGVVMIKAPLVFFEDAMFRNIVGYSPGFGRVGCFVSTECNKEKMYNAWIAYIEFVENSDLQSLLVLFDVVWTLDIKCKPEKIAKTDMHYLSTGRLRGFEMASGIVVEKAASKGKIFNTEDDLCDFDVSCAGDLQLGVFVKFVPICNFSMTIVAVDAHSVIGPKNVQW